MPRAVCAATRAPRYDQPAPAMALGRLGGERTSEGRQNRKNRREERETSRVRRAAKQPEDIDRCEDIDIDAEILLFCYR